ncbi:hypothetical protein [Streptomyces roseolus]|uniref:hypothetical protein n=1 Tax=Streptomyces roseolus TaxID=67358 RepID=UPI00378C3FF3
MSGKFGVGRRGHRWGFGRMLVRWTPKALVWRGSVRVTKWGLRLLGWCAWLALRRAVRARMPKAVRHRR